MIAGNLLFAGALLFDTLVGDPRSAWHPVALIGKLITCGEQRLLQPANSGAAKKRAGVCLLIFVVGLVYLAGFAFVWLTSMIGGWLAPAAAMLALSFTVSPRSLRAAADEIYTLLAAGDLAGARRQVGLIVGRDTGGLDEAEITRATVETVAENITDGIVAPLVFAAVGGVPLAFAYRAVNTLDSMVGYKNERYMDFGWGSARFDDVCNYIPARITAMLILLAAALLPGCDAKGAWRALWRDAARHPSPNSGYAEAPVAGALGIRLGGCNYYFGRPSWRAYMGEEKERLSAKHIKQTVNIMCFVTVALVLILTVGAGAY